VPAARSIEWAVCFFKKIMNTHTHISILTHKRSMTTLMRNGLFVDIPVLGTTDDAHVMAIITREIACAVLSGDLTATTEDGKIVTIAYRVNAESQLRRYAVVELDVQQPDGSIDDDVLARGTYWIDDRGSDPVVWDAPRKAALLPQVIREDASLMLWWMWQYQHDEMTTGGGIYQFRWDDAIEAPM